MLNFMCLLLCKLVQSGTHITDSDMRLGKCSINIDIIINTCICTCKTRLTALVHTQITHALHLCVIQLTLEGMLVAK